MASPSGKAIWKRVTESGVELVRPRTATNTAAAATTQGMTGDNQRRGAGGGAQGRAPQATYAADPGFTSAAANSAAEPNRSAGSFSSALSTAASTCGGTVCRCGPRGRGVSVITFATIACAVGPAHGGSPHNT